MAMLEQLTRAPSIADFTPLSEHQSATPSHFFGAKPVLHLYSPASQLLISQADLDAHPLFSALYASPSTNGSSGTANGTQDEQITVENIDIWVTSENLILFAPAQSTGIEIPYPRLSLHALLTLPASSTQGLYMQLVLSEQPANTADEDLETLECTLVPSASALLSSAPAPESANNTETETDAGGESTQTPAQALYASVTACADLHPDPAEDGEDIEMPGAGGWITSENLHEFMDEEGNLAIGGEESSLGTRAGAVRDREDEAEEEAGETKWQRTG